MLGWALMVNALTMARHRAAEGLEAGLTHSPSGTTPTRIKAVSDTSRKPRWRYRVLTHLHSLHFNALVMTSVAISARFSTGPGQVGVVEIA